MDLSKKSGSVDVDLYQYDECAAASLSIHGGILCGVLVLAIFSPCFPFVYYSVTLSLAHPVLSLAKTAPCITQKSFRHFLLPFNPLSHSC